MTDANLIVLTTHFGTNFSGGSTATCEIVKRLQHHFSTVTVIGRELGEHDIHNLEFERYHQLRDIPQRVNQLSKQLSVVYGDFFNSVALARSDIPFYFTYHDNWPELGQTSVNMRLKGLYYWRAYRTIFGQAKHVFTVSTAKHEELKQYTNNLSMVRNGLGQYPNSEGFKDEIRLTTRKVLMVGNIDQRKYRLALKLFRTLPASTYLTIDIYGHIKNEKIATQLSNFPFVNLKGFVKSIPFQQYRCLLHTSIMENLSMAWCEAAAHGIPVLTFDVGAASEVIDPGRGVVIEFGNIALLKEHLLHILYPEVATINAASDIESRSNLISEYSWDKAADHYAAYLVP